MTGGAGKRWSEAGLRVGVARLLGAGTWISCALLAAGLSLDAVSPAAHARASLLLRAGVATLIALPSLRVALLLCWFGLRREYDFAAIAAIVLAIVAFSTFLAPGAG